MKQPAFGWRIVRNSPVTYNSNNRRIYFYIWGIVYFILDYCFIYIFSLGHDKTSGITMGKSASYMCMYFQKDAKGLSVLSYS